MTHHCSKCGLFHPSGAACLALKLPTAPGVQALAPAALLAGRYRIVRVIQRGGASVVYEASDALAPQRRVALKELRPNAEATPQERAEAEAWFARESALLSQLRHPRIPAFYSVFQEEGRSYLTQEYIDGENLDQVVRQRGPLPERQVVGWGVALCELLIYLHEHSDGPVVFRDLKPANILLRAPDDYLMVVDFGIARRYKQGVAGTVIGTPGYAPPEQYQGLATPRSDVYALGATLHRLLTGYDPEQGAPFAFPPVRQLNRLVSAPLAALVDRALLLDPAGRFASATEMRDELEALARSHAAVPLWQRARASARYRRAWGVLAATLLVGASAVGLAAHSASTPGNSTLGQVSAYMLDGVPVGIAPGPDGNMWYLDTPAGSKSGAVGRLTLGGVSSSIPIDTVPFGIQNITAGPAGQLWYIGGGNAANRVERLDVGGYGNWGATPTPQLAYPVPAHTKCYTVLGDSAGTVWLTCNGPASSHYLERVPRQGHTASYALPGDGDVNDIAFGRDGSVWVTQGSEAGGRLWRVSAQGKATAFPLPNYGYPFTIAAGPDGNMWFTICNAYQNGSLQVTAIGRISPQGTITQFPVNLAATPGLSSPSIKPASDGNVWFTIPDQHLLGRITPLGAISYYAIPDRGTDGTSIGYSYPDALITGPDGNLWVLQAGSPQVLRFDPRLQLP